MKFESKSHMVKELIAGKRFVDRRGFEIFYDEDHMIPFRVGKNAMEGYWSAFDADIWTEVGQHQNEADEFYKAKKKTDLTFTTIKVRTKAIPEWANFVLQTDRGELFAYDELPIVQYDPDSHVVRATKQSGMCKCYDCKTEKEFYPVKTFTIVDK